MRVVAAPPQTFEYITERTGCVPTSRARAIAAIDVDGRLRGMALFDGWTENSVQVHVAVDAPIVLRPLLPALFEYAFIQTGRGVLIGAILSTNRRSLGAALGLGFREAGRIRDGVSVGDDLVLMELRRENCRWLQKKAA